MTISQPLLPRPQAAELLTWRRAARSKLLDFVLATKPDYEPGWHHRLLCKYLDRFVAGELRRLMVFMPPQHGKSTLVSRHLPAYILGRNPNTRVIACSYSADLASRMNRDVQRLIDTDTYRSLFPRTQLFGRRNRTDSEGAYLRNSDLFEIVGYQGSYRSAGVGGGIAGMSLDLGIVDDPVKNREEADSPTQRESLWEWYTSTFFSRRSRDAGILLTMTRWNIDDLAGRLLKLAADDPKADQWTVLRLPALAEDSRHPDDPRQPGQALWPERYPLTELEKTRANSEYEFAALYQGEPAPEGGTEWPSSWFGSHLWFDEWPPLVVKVLALDPSKGRDAKSGDYSAFALIGVDKAGILWVDIDAARRPTPAIVERGFELCRTWRPQAFAIETNAYQELLGVEFLRVARDRGITLPVYGIGNMTPKPVRIRRLGPYFAQQRIRLRASAGCQQLLGEARQFPLAAHDDCLDSLELGVRMLDHLRGQRDTANQPQILRAA